MNSFSLLMIFVREMEEKRGFVNSIKLGVNIERNVNEWLPEAHSALITWAGHHTLCREIAYPTTACARSAAL